MSVKINPPTLNPPQTGSLTFGVTTDPISGIRDGILKRPATDPLVFQVDSANEFWQMNASLNVSEYFTNSAKRRRRV